MKFADTHLHMTEKSVSYGYPDIDNADLLFSCSAQYSEWELQSSIDDPRVTRFYGVHPWYADQWNSRIRDELTSLISNDPDAQIGEIGLDGKRENMDKQLTVFTEQVVISSRFGRTVNIHNIGCDGEILRIMKKYGKGCRSVILHSFKGTNVKQYDEMNCFFSINPRILSKSEDHIQEILSAIPHDRIVLESDAPYTSKEFSSMESFITTLSAFMNLEPEELAELSLSNARRALE